MGPVVTVESLTLGAFASNCHLLRPAGTAGVLVVDPGDEAPAILDHLDRAGVTVAAYLITHGHIDHVSALAAVHRARPAPVGMHPLDLKWAFTAINAMEPWYPQPVEPAGGFARKWAEGQTWTDLGLTYRIMETPGHSPGSVSFYFEQQGLIFSGDVLFAGGIGRTDLPGGDAPTLLRSLGRLMELPDEVRVYSGHGPVTTIGRERKRNPFLRDTSWAG
jgi:glyoxylase-like metal-dependent hydrolase (beta-lactamase superfamily II)